MGSENFSLLEELRNLDQQIDRIETVSGLQPLFARVEEITKQYSGDFEIQLAAHDVRQRILAKGSRLKQEGPAQTAPPPPAAPSAAPPPPRPAAPLASPPPSAAPSSPLAAPGLRTPLTNAPPVRREDDPPKKRKLMPIAWVAMSLAAIAGAAISFNAIRDRNAKIAATTMVDVNIATEPSGAAIQVNGQQTCISDCVAKLLPGTYTIAAVLEGFEPSTGEVIVTPNEPAQLKLTLAPQVPRVRIVAEMASGQVFLDDQPAGELQEGQFVLDRLSPGAHTVRITGGTSEATIPVELVAGAMPAVTGSIATKNLLAVVVPHAGSQARVITNAPAKLTFNGQVQPDASPSGVDLAGFQPGATELVLGQGPTQKTVLDSLGAIPELAVFLKTDQDIGTLLITTGEDDVRVFVNNRENRRRTEKGQLRLQTFGKVTIRVAKPGFEEVPPQTATVAKGAEVKMNFTLKEIPKLGTLVISGGTPFSEVLLDGRPAGSVAGDGGYRNDSVAPGEHTIELRREQFQPKRLTRTFRAGQTATIAGADATLAAVPPPPPPPPPPPKPEPAPVKPPPPKPQSGDMLSFDAPGQWREEAGIWKHRGQATLTYRLTPNGIFTFSIYMLRGGNILRGGRVRWLLNYTDAKNYALFELDEENFWTKVVDNGKTFERKKVPHRQDKSMRVWNIQIDVNASRAIHKIQGDNGWIELDNWSEPGRDWTKGKFGILVNGSDEVGLSNFQFTGR